jgi:hypothetical protein
MISSGPINSFAVFLDLAYSRRRLLRTRQPIVPDQVAERALRQPAAQ